MDQASRNYYSLIINDILSTIKLLYFSMDIESKNSLLQRLEEQISQLSQLINMTQLNNATIEIQGKPKVFTMDELIKYDGTNGNPAYVAVGGVVYDVTNNPAWAAGNHFGLKSGGNYTDEFAACHANQDILSKLKQIGRLQDERLL